MLLSKKEKKRKEATSNLLYEFNVSKKISSRRNMAAGIFDPIDRKDVTAQQKSTAQQQRKLTKDSGYETSVCSEPDYVNATFFSCAIEPHGTMLPPPHQPIPDALFRLVLCSFFGSIPSPLRIRFLLSQ